MRRHMLTVWVALVLCALGACHADEMLCDFDDLEGWAKSGTTAAFELSTEAHPGNSCIHVTMPGQVRGTISKEYPPAEWDRYHGVSFWAKGDGSDQWGCVALEGYGSNRGHSFCYFFPLKSEDWREYRVPWRDWIPEGTQNNIGAVGSLPPSGIQSVRIGTRWTITHNNAKIPQHEYWLDGLRLVDDLPPAPPVPSVKPLSAVIELLRAKEPVHIVCMGDSITAGTSLRNRDAERYAVVLQAELRQRLGYDGIFCESRAVGGAKLMDARAWVQRDFPDPAPDLITTLYGYNDKSGKWSQQQFAEALGDYLDRLATVTHGRTALMPMTTIPGGGPRFTMLDDFAQAVRRVSEARGLVCCDLQLTFKELGREGMLPLMADMAHPNAEGHRVIAGAIAELITAQVKAGQ